MSPMRSASRTVVSGTSLPNPTRSSYGLFASSDIGWVTGVSDIASGSVERAVDHVHLLLARETDEIHRVAGHPDGEARVLLRVVHRVHQRLAVQHVDVHVV